mmetsp:Transcript_1751/g.4420  ORF Transcript_1751/g.4420 Transcript_1751/m.4420 type:complete len:213 (-) Transcript_1751:1861-2499(-)
MNPGRWCQRKLWRWWWCRRAAWDTKCTAAWRWQSWPWHRAGLRPSLCPHAWWRSRAAPEARRRRTEDAGRTTRRVARGRRAGVREACGWRESLRWQPWWPMAWEAGRHAVRATRPARHTSVWACACTRGIQVSRWHRPPHPCLRHKRPERVACWWSPRYSWDRLHRHWPGDRIGRKRLLPAPTTRGSRGSAVAPPMPSAMFVTSSAAAASGP